jgi:hypothetical protein
MMNREGFGRKRPRRNFKAFAGGTVENHEKP